jgi:putative FmdB family regulatory protein
MPIYAYKCASCGYAQDVLQKVSDPVLTHCPQCEAATFAKQLTAAGFQLRGSGWYATDFKNGSGKTTSTPTESKGADSGNGAKTDGAKTDGAKTDGAKTDGAKTDGAKTDGAKTEKTSTAASDSCGHGGCSACS